MWLTHITKIHSETRWNASASLDCRANTLSVCTLMNAALTHGDCDTFQFSNAFFSPRGVGWLSRMATVQSWHTSLEQVVSLMSLWNFKDDSVNWYLMILYFSLNEITMTFGFGSVFQCIACMRACICNSYFVLNFVSFGKRFSNKVEFWLMFGKGTALISWTAH